MPQFLPTAWSYGMFQGDVLDELIPLLGEHRATPLALEYTKGGGKALGLRLCQELAKRSRHLEVPEWTSLGILEQVHLAFARRHIREFLSATPNDEVIVRSSHAQEDWIDLGAGVHTSQHSPARLLGQMLPTFIRQQLPVVLQKFVRGIGIVVDVAYSQLLGQVVVRIATGRDFIRDEIQSFSSATWDHEGVLEVRDPETGRKVIPQQHGHLYSSLAKHLPYSLLARELHRVVSDLGIRFGVQLELVIHPGEPMRWHLVQVRPSPLQLRGEQLARFDTAPRIGVSAAVTGVFDHTGPVCTMPESCMEALTVLGVSGDISADDRDAFTRIVPSGSVAVWPKQPDQDFGILQMETLHRMGVVAQLTPGIAALNTTHGSVERRTAEIEAMVEHTRHNGAVIGLPSEPYMLLAGLGKSKTGPQVRLRSDGIVGNVHVL